MMLHFKLLVHVVNTLLLRPPHLQVAGMRWNVLWNVLHRKYTLPSRSCLPEVNKNKVARLRGLQACPLVIKKYYSRCAL